MYDRLAHFYGFFQEASDMEATAKFIKSFNPKAQKFLEIGPGTGELLFTLARDHTIGALEPSEAMRALILTKLNSTRAFDSNLTIFPNADTIPSSHYDLAFARNVYFLLSKKEKRHLLCSVRDKLKAGGKFLFNIALKGVSRPDTDLSMIAERHIGLMTYKHFSGTKQISSHESEVHWRFELSDGPKILESIEEKYRVTQDTLAETHALLEDSGFRKIGEYGDFEGKVVANSSSQAVLVAEPRS
jgi:SAM-dependent methyltransferase